METWRQLGWDLGYALCVMWEIEDEARRLQRELAPALEEVRRGLQDLRRCADPGIRTESRAADPLSPEKPHSPGPIGPGPPAGVVIFRWVL
jgi:hypothetical protein